MVIKGVSKQNNQPFFHVFKETKAGAKNRPNSLSLFTRLAGHLNFVVLNICATFNRIALGRLQIAMAINIYRSNNSSKYTEHLACYDPKHYNHWKFYHLKWHQQLFNKDKHLRN